MLINRFEEGASSLLLCTCYSKVDSCIHIYHSSEGNFVNTGLGWVTVGRW